jgi:penicillin-binding protein 1C
VKGYGRRRLVRWLRRLFLTLTIFLLTGWAAFTAAVVWWPYPPDIDRPRAPATLIEDRHGQPLALLAAPDGMLHLPLGSIEDLGPYLPNAIVSVEDARFYAHHGVDWRAALAAAWSDVTSLRIRRGASTIDMQLHHLRDPRPRTPWNKLEQAVRAAQIDRHADKHAILLEYCNRAPFGGNLVGAAVASWRYFGKPCDRLSLAQAALLAGLPQSPNRYRPDRHPDRALNRRNHLLDRMLRRGAIDRAEHDRAVAEPLELNLQVTPQSQDPALAAALPTLIAAPLSQQTHTTLDVSIQKEAYAAASQHLAQLDIPSLSAVAVVVLGVQSGDCLAAVNLMPAARSPAGIGLDLVNARRSIGSVLKPFIYAAAFDDGLCGPRTILHDAPATWTGYAPRNFDQSFRGELTAAEALAQSRNIPAMQLLFRVGVKRIARLLHDLGLRSLSPDTNQYGLTLAVGGIEASALEVAQAYAALARGGVTQEGGRSLKRESCDAVLGALASPQRTAAICEPAARLGVAWKTGTSSGNRDAWCAAVTRRRVVVVWVGDPRGGNGDAAFKGIDAAAPLALRILASIDPDGRGWSAPAATNIAPIQPISPESIPSRLSIVSPASGQRILIASDDSPERQCIRLRAKRSGAGADPLFWFIDGQPMEGVAEETWWTPTPGRHLVKAVTQSGDAASVIVNVTIPASVLTD